MRSRHLSRCLLLAFVTPAVVVTVAGVLHAIEPVTAVEGKVEKVDRAAKTILVRAADGTEHTFYLDARTVAHGGKATQRGAEATAREVQEGSEVVVHATKKGGQEP